MPVISMGRSRSSVGDRASTAVRFREARPLIVLLALALSACGERSAQQAASAPPPVTVAQPVKRTVTDWDEFTGRFEAVEEVQVRARVGGFVTNVEFKDGDMVHVGDLLYLIDSRPFEAVAAQADGQLADARAKAELAKRDLDRGLNLVQTSAVSEQVVDQRRQALQAAHAAETVAERRVHPCAGTDRWTGQPPFRERRQSGAGQRQRLLDLAHHHRLA